MSFFKHHLHIKRSVFIAILVTFCFVTSGLGILAFPKPKTAEAVVPNVDVKEVLNKVLVAVWKTTIFPLIKKIMLSVITKGDFPITWDSFKQWLYKDLAFQVVESILNQFGFTLCSRFSLNIKLALQQHLAGTWGPDCTWDESWLATTLEDCIQSGSDACWAKIRGDALKSIFISAQGSNNQFTRWFKITDTFHSRVARSEGDLRLEISANTGFLNSRDCDKWKKELHDTNRDGEMQNEECPLRTAGEAIAHMLNPYGPLQDASFKSVVWTDMMSLTAQIIDTLLEDAIKGVASKINEWKSDQQREAATEYREIKAKQRTGVNNPITIPEE